MGQLLVPVSGEFFWWFSFTFFSCLTHASLLTAQGTVSTGGLRDVLYGTLDGKASDVESQDCGRNDDKPQLVPDVEIQDCSRDDDKPQLALDAVALKEAVWHLPARHAHLRRGPFPLRLPHPRCCHWGTSPSRRLAVGDAVTLVMLLLYVLLAVTNFSLVPRPVDAGAAGWKAQLTM